MTEVRIGEIRIRFRGVPEPTARESLDGIGREVLGILARQNLPGGPAGTRSRKIGRLDAGTIDPGSTADPVEIRTRIAERIAGLVEAGLR